MTLGAIGVGMMTSHVLVAQQTPVTRTTLQQKDLEGAPAKEMVMYVADVAPGGVAGRHSHPGPEVAYVVVVLIGDKGAAMTNPVK